MSEQTEHVGNAGATDQDEFTAFVPIRSWEENGGETFPKESPPRLRLGPWDGARVALLRCPILRPGQAYRTQKETEKQIPFQIDFLREATNMFRIDFYLTQRGGRIASQ